MNRRDALKLASTTLLSGWASTSSAVAPSPARRSKRVIVGGGGIAGLACAYELVKGGHDVTILEASGRAGGHVKTIRDPFQDGLYADAGAEHFYYPGYNTYQRYAEEFSLPIAPYPRRDNMLRFISGKMYTEDDLHSRSVLGGLGFNLREIDYLAAAENPWWNIPLVYLQRYVDRIEKEDTPFGWGIDDLDQISVSDLMKRDGASAAVIRFAGSDASALETIWNAGIKKLRHTPLLSRKIFRIRGGNQGMTDAFVARLRDRIRLGCTIAGIEQGSSGVMVSFQESGQAKKMEAEYLACCMSAVMLRRLPITPPLPQARAYPVFKMPYYSVARVVFQSRTAFWEKDGLSPNMEFGEPLLNDCWRMAEEVESRRAILIGSAAASATAEDALAAFRKYYPGKSEDIEQVVVVNWAIHPSAMACERVNYPPGELRKFWPIVTEPVGRIHFAGAYAANMPWGQEAALESANRVATAIDAS